MPEMIHDRVSQETADGVARIELANPDSGNALDLAMGQAFEEAVDHVLSDVAAGLVRVVVVSAQGRMFSVGGDLGEFSTVNDRGAHVKATADALHAGLTALHALEVPVVSVVQGTVAGGGLGIALVGDIVIAAAEAKFVVAYTAAGLSPDCGVSWILPRRLSGPRLMDLALTNRPITGVEAADWGLVSRAVPATELAETVDGIVSGLRDGAEQSLIETKRLLRASLGRSAPDQMQAEGEGISRLIAGPEGAEGIDAFLAKRRPEFR